MTAYDPDTHRRRSLRLQGYNYTGAGAHFVTICAHNRARLFGEVVEEHIRLNDNGRIVETEWWETARLRPNIKLDAFVIMPNHVHGIIWLSGQDHCSGTARRAPTDKIMLDTARRAPTFGRPIAESLATIVGAFKSAVTRRINALRGTPGAPVWQRNYYEHVIRNDHELDMIREYIINNPLQWALDRENPDRSGLHPLYLWLYKEA